MGESACIFLYSGLLVKKGEGGSSSMAKITPMMQQYFEIKENYKHCLLFFRLGDFYEDRKSTRLNSVT